MQVLGVWIHARKIVGAVLVGCAVELKRTIGKRLHWIARAGGSLEDHVLQQMRHPALSKPLHRAARFDHQVDVITRLQIIGGQQHLQAIVQSVFADTLHAAHQHLRMHGAYCPACLKENKIEFIITALTYNPRLILGLPQHRIEEGAEANLTVFSLKLESVLTENSNYSKSANSPFLNKKMQGKIIGVINGTKSFFN